MPKVINFKDREKEIKRILKGFDPVKVAKMDEDELYHTFTAEFGIKSKDGKQNSWRKFSMAVIDSAVFLSRFKNAGEFTSFVKKFDTDTQTRIALALLISARIKGIGFALACDTLKELGFLEYPKPDVHIVQICKELDLCSDNPCDVFETIVNIAKDNNVITYRVDKILWLICSGKYYFHGIKTKSLKKDFIEQLKGELGSV